MDRLEDNMERAAQSMKGGKEETAEALIKQRSARKVSADISEVASRL